jgi:hypothetical protein
LKGRGPRWADAGARRRKRRERERRGSMVCVGWLVGVGGRLGLGCVG